MNTLTMFPAGKLDDYMRTVVKPRLDFVFIYNYFIYKEDVFAKWYIHPRFSGGFIDYIFWSFKSNGPLNTS